MSRQGFLLYALLLSVVSTVAVALFSAWLAFSGHVLPWIVPLADGSGFAIRNAWILLPGVGLGSLLALGSHYLAVRTNNRRYYYAGWVVVVVVVAAVALLLYGGACGYCAKVVCTAGGVKSCGVKLQISVTFFQIYCECYQPSSWLPTVVLSALGRM